MAEPNFRVPKLTILSMSYFLLSESLGGGKGLKDLFGSNKKTTYYLNHANLGSHSNFGPENKEKHIHGYTCFEHMYATAMNATTGLFGVFGMEWN